MEERNKMKKIKIISILLLFVMLILPKNLKAATVSTLISGPSLAQPGETIIYTISVNSPIEIVSFNGNISVNGATISSFAPSIGIGGLNGSKIGLMFDTLKTGSIEIGELEVKIPFNASLESEITINLAGTVGKEDFTNTDFQKCNKVVKIAANDNIQNNNDNSNNDSNNNNLIPPSSSEQTKINSDNNIVQNSNDNSKSITKSSINTLKTLQIEGIEFVFDKDVLEYNLEVDYDVEEIILNYELDDSKASVKIEGGSLLNIGKNEKRIVITAENGEERIYTLMINRKEKNDIIKIDSDYENEEVITDKGLDNASDKTAIITISLISFIICIMAIILIILKNKRRNS